MILSAEFEGVSAGCVVGVRACWDRHHCGDERRVPLEDSTEEDVEDATVMAVALTALVVLVLGGVAAAVVTV